MKRNVTQKDGHITAKVPFAYELPKLEVTLQSGKTLYRFTGSYDGERSLPSKLLRLMYKSSLAEKDREH